MKIYGRPEKSRYYFSYESDNQAICSSNAQPHQKANIIDSNGSKLANTSIDRSSLRLTLGTSFLVHFHNSNEALKIVSQGFWGNRHQFEHQGSCYSLYAHKFREVSLYSKNVQVARFDFHHFGLLKKPTIEIDFHKNLDPILLISIAMSLTILKNKHAEGSNSVDFGKLLDSNKNKYNPDWTAMN